MKKERRVEISQETFSLLLERSENLPSVIEVEQNSLCMQFEHYPSINEFSCTTYILPEMTEFWRVQGRSCTFRII